MSKSSSSVSKTKMVIIAALAMVVGLAVGVLASKALVKPSVASNTSSSLRLRGNTFTSPLLLGDVSNDKNSPELEGLSKKVQGIIDAAKKDGSITSAGVFYRSLQSSKQINVNGTEKFFPASLTKVPLLVAYLKVSESEPDLLTTPGKLEFSEDYNAGQEIKPAESPVSGQEYTINDLLGMMIKYSDNTSFELLINRPGAQDELKKVYDDFRLYYPFDDAPHDIMTPREFALFFRTLYNATYLSVADSEKALSLMSQSDYKQGIVAGVPNNVKVAHKFGLNTNRDQTGAVVMSRELHDCGIIYQPQKPYVLCIMTKSTADLPKIESVIKNISATIYAETSKK